MFLIEEVHYFQFHSFLHYIPVTLPLYCCNFNELTTIINYLYHFYFHTGEQKNLNIGFEMNGMLLIWFGN